MPEPESRLDVLIQQPIGALAVDLAFRTAAPWTVLFGPSGSGKTTALRAIAGFLRLRSGHVSLEYTTRGPLVLSDPSRRIHVPVHRRPFRTAAQRPSLFPRLSVRENVYYGTKGDGAAAESTLERLHLQALAGLPVGKLSGGETQRVALARTIAAARAAGPGTWLLLDEPFTGLDLRLRIRLTREVCAWMGELGHPVLSVTHDVAEVFALRAEVICIEAGRVVATGDPETVLAEERKRVLAELGSGSV